jgi:hypothetical protein
MSTTTPGTTSRGPAPITNTNERRRAAAQTVRRCLEAAGIAEAEGAVVQSRELDSGVIRACCVEYEPAGDRQRHGPCDTSMCCTRERGTLMT